jgi:hypothetical protein
MKNISLYFLFLLIINFSYGQNHNLQENIECFDTNRIYEYNAIYIDENGDTITIENIIQKPLGRPWLPQPWLQRAIKYIYYTDTVGYKNYIDPDIFFHKKNMKYLEKHGKLRLSNKEVTGATLKRDMYYMHPPRRNQYRMLFYAPHPLVYSYSLTDSIYSFSRNAGIIGLGGDLTQEYKVTQLRDTLINKKQVKAWNVFVISGGELNEYNESLGIIDSKLDAIFTREYGFIKLHYTFENDIKIHFDIVDVKIKL